jgi:phosphoglycolate phosphatase
MAVLLFDLDGTLIDSAVGITRCVAHALENLGEAVPSEQELRPWIGPPLRDSFRPLLNDEARVEAAVSLYRERFEDVGWAEHEVYPDVGEAIWTLAEAGHRLAVVTAKNEPHARRIVAHLPFGALFEAVIGADREGRRNHKPELIGEALHRLQTVAGSCWMIGDRWMDIAGAHQHGMRSVGVLWGFGDREELEAHAPTHLVEAPRQLPLLVA